MKEFASDLQRDLNLHSKSFRKFEFLLYKFLRLVMWPLGQRLAMRIAISLHWTIKRLSTTLVSHYYGVAFLNAKSAVIQGRLIEKYCSLDSTVVDLACGTAPYAPNLELHGITAYIGYDLNEDHIESNLKKYPNFNFEQRDVMKTHFLPQCDVMIVSHFIEHISNPDEFLLQIKNHCTLLIVEVPDFFSDPLNIIAYGLNRPWWSDPDHKREYSVASLQSLFKRTGFQILEIVVHGGTIGVVCKAETLLPILE